MYGEIINTDFKLDDGTLFGVFTSGENSDLSACAGPSRSKVAVAYCDRLPKSRRRVCEACCKPFTRQANYNSIKKTNQATTTERTKYKDVSTVTKSYRHLCKKKKKKKRMGWTCDKSICTEAKLVKFMSRTQIIPPCKLRIFVNS